MTGHLAGTAICLILLGTSAAPARTPTQGGTPEQMQRLLACQAQTDAAARLGCFDREAAAVKEAIGRRDLVLIDRARANQARRGLFGFSVPSFGGLFGGDERDEIRQVESSVTRSTRNGEGGWTVRLADGSTWTQTDDNPIALEPRPGDKVVVKRGLLGSFTLSVNRQPGVKVRRIG